jgi:hypothetical protein
MSAKTSGFKSFKNNKSGPGSDGTISPSLIVEGLPPNMNKPSNAIIIEGFDRVQNRNSNNNNPGVNSSTN